MPSWYEIEYTVPQPDEQGFYIDRVRVANEDEFKTKLAALKHGNRVNGNPMRWGWVHRDDGISVRIHI